MLVPRVRHEATSSRRSAVPGVVQGQGTPGPLSCISATTGRELAAGRRETDGCDRRRNEELDLGARAEIDREESGGAKEDGKASKEADAPSDTGAATAAQRFVTGRVTSRSTPCGDFPLRRALIVVQTARAALPGREAGGNQATSWVPHKSERNRRSPRSADPMLWRWSRLGSPNSRRARSP
jgi:hypothetical protein